MPEIPAPHTMTVTMPGGRTATWDVLHGDVVDLDVRTEFDTARYDTFSAHRNAVYVSTLTVRQPVSVHRSPSMVVVEPWVVPAVVHGWSSTSCLCGHQYDPGADLTARIDAHAEHVADSHTRSVSDIVTSSALRV